MRKLYHSYLSPYARRVLIVLAEKGLEYKSYKHKFAREFESLSAINPCLLLPVYIDDAVHLWGSNLIVEYLLKTHPTTPNGIAGTTTRFHDDPPRPSLGGCAYFGDIGDYD
jgi:glutathione S-transferase